MKKEFVLILVLAIITMLTAGCSAFAEEASASGPEEEYVPKRIRLSESNRGPVKVEQKNGEVEYEALFSDGLLNKLEVELNTKSGSARAERLNTPNMKRTTGRSISTVRNGTTATGKRWKVRIFPS